MHHWGRLAVCGLLVAIPAKSLRAEEVTVFAADENLVDIPRPTVVSDIETEDRELTLLIYKPGQNLGTLATGETDLASISKKALAEDQSEAPFFGPGYEFILRDTKGQHFIALFEYEKGHKTLRGFRAALAPLNDLGSKAAVFVGYPYQGVIFDKEILKQLKDFADRMPEKKKEKDEDKAKK